MFTRDEPKASSGADRIEITNDEMPPSFRDHTTEEIFPTLARLGSSGVTIADAKPSVDTHTLTEFSEAVDYQSSAEDKWARNQSQLGNLDPDVRRTKRLLHWYDKAVRSFLEKTVTQREIAEFDKDRSQLLKTVQLADKEVAVCFLGTSGVGKSTLINAMVGGAQAVVPSGGVGPLTAQALVVRSHPRPGFEVEYHGRGQILKTVFGLEQMFRIELGSPAETQDSLSDLNELEESELPEDATTLSEEADSDSKTDADLDRRERREQLKRCAQLLVTGSQDQNRDVRYLIDSLREAASLKRVWGTDPDSEDMVRMNGIHRALARAKEGKTFELHGSAVDEGFSRSLSEHATGYLAPLIKNLTVNWQCLMLANGISLVDLPGVGVVKDVHADVTRKWIREKAQALVLVVDHRGMTVSLADALRRSEFLNSLLYSADEPEDDPIVLVAVTRMDDLARDLYIKDKSKKKFEHFRDVVEEAKARLRNELQRRLEDIWLSGDDTSPAREQVVRNLVSTLQVHPLSAPEYARLIAEDEDDPSFLRGINQSGIPDFIGSLEKLAKDRRVKAMARLSEQASVFRERLVTTLRLIEAQWEGESHAEEEAARLRKDLEVFIQPLRKELANRQGGVSHFFKEGHPAED